MAIPISSLSVAIQGIATFLGGFFDPEVQISTDSPHRASERVKGLNATHLLNLFTYRVMPSGFHADAASNEPFFIRINTLLTPFLNEQDGGILDLELRILGHAIRALNSNPVLPSPGNVLPGNSPNPADFNHHSHLDYRLQAILQAPSMEELNHIWTTQGGDLSYRLSAAYEFALIPIEPLERRTPPAPMTTSILDMQPNMDAADAEGFIEYGDEATAFPVGSPDGPDTEVPTNWLPVVLFAGGERLSNSGTVDPGTANIDIAIAGPPGVRVAVEVSWLRADEREDTQAPQAYTIATPVINEPEAIHALDLTNAADGDTAILHTRPADQNDDPIATSPFANTVLITVSAP
jgi:hypothetical protein